MKTSRNVTTNEYMPIKYGNLSSLIAGLRFSDLNSTNQ